VALHEQGLKAPAIQAQLVHENDSWTISAAAVRKVLSRSGGRHSDENVTLSRGAGVVASGIAGSVNSYTPPVT
jgi:hypothetical protein